MANQFLVKNRMADMQNLSATEITALETGTYAGVELLGYYEKGDTPAPIIYHFSTTTEHDDGGSVIETGGIKLKHEFSGIIHAAYYGVSPTVDNKSIIEKIVARINAYGHGTIKFNGEIPIVYNEENKLFKFNNLSHLNIEAENATFIVNDYNDFASGSVTYTGTYPDIVATLTSDSPHELSKGNIVVIKDSVDPAYNNYFEIKTVLNTNSFTFRLTKQPLTVLPTQTTFRKNGISKVLFAVYNCQNVNFGTVTFRGTIQPLSIQARLGWAVFQFFNKCSNITGTVVATGCVYGIKSGDYNVDIGDCHFFNCRVIGSDIGYPVSMYKSGHNSFFHVEAERVHRGGYITGVKNTTYNAVLKDYDITGVLIGFHPVADVKLYGCENVTVNVFDNGTNLPQNAQADIYSDRVSVGLRGYGVEDPTAVMQGIKINIQSKNAKWVMPFSIISFNSVGSIKDITVSGLIDRTGLHPSEITGDFSIGQENTTKGIYENIHLNNFIVENPKNAILINNSIIDLPKAQSDVYFNNYQSTTSLTSTIGNGYTIKTNVVSDNKDILNVQEAALQGLNKGIYFNRNINVSQLGYPINDSTFSLIFNFKVPTTDMSLVHIGAASIATPSVNGLQLLVSQGTLIVRLYGSVLTSYYQIVYNEFVNKYKNKTVSVAFIRSYTGFKVFINGKEVITTTESVEGALFNNSIDGLNVVIGNASYIGSVSELKIFNYDISNRLDYYFYGGSYKDVYITNNPYLVLDTIGNGGFEIAGSNTVFQSWDQNTQGSTGLAISTDAYKGNKSCKFIGDANNSFIAISKSGLLNIGSEYEIAMAIKRISGTGTSLLLSGFGADLGIGIQNTSWLVRSVFGISTTTQMVIKRNVLTNTEVLIDNVIVKRIGILSKDLFATDIPLATTGIKGLVNQAAALASITQMDLMSITTADGSDAATTQTLVNAIKVYINTNVVPLVNATKASQNEELTNQRSAGQQAI